MWLFYAVWTVGSLTLYYLGYTYAKKRYSSPTAVYCGGCLGLGSHRKHCLYNPRFSRWRMLADEAEGLGDNIGANDCRSANSCYGVASSLRVMADEIDAGTWESNGTRS